MKKTGIGLIILLLCLTGFITFFIPKTLEIASFEKIKCNSNSCKNFFLRPENDLLKWVQKKSSIQKDSSFIFNGFKYKITGKNTLGLDIDISKKGLFLNSRLLILSYTPDSTILQWQTTLPTNNSPIDKVTKYFAATEIKENFNLLLKQLAIFFEDNQNIYSFNIQRAKVTDTIVITTSFLGSQYPATKEIYAALDLLKKQITVSNAQITNNPMLNIKKISSTQFETQVALPINKTIPATGNCKVQIMFPGHLLYCPVKGGNTEIERAFTALENYIKDYNLTSPAIPYQVLTTNRLAEPDYSKWMTTIYYPVY